MLSFIKDWKETKERQRLAEKDFTEALGKANEAAKATIKRYKVRAY